MDRARRLETLLFWLMATVGGGCLAACLVLPAWLEYRVARLAYAAAEQRVAQLERRLTAVGKQIEHIQKDPAYNERLARREFGIQQPGVATIHLDLPPREPSPPVPAEPGDLLERLAARVDEAARRNPLVAAFVLDETRPAVMGLSGGLLLTALLLSCGSLRLRAAPQKPSRSAQAG